MCGLILSPDWAKWAQQRRRRRGRPIWKRRRHQHISIRDLTGDDDGVVDSAQFNRPDKKMTTTTVDSGKAWTRAFLLTKSSYFTTPFAHLIYLHSSTKKISQCDGSCSVRCLVFHNTGRCWLAQSLPLTIVTIAIRRVVTSFYEHI